MADPEPTDRTQLAQLLRLYAESGLDFAVGPDPVDRFAAAQTPATKKQAAARTEPAKPASPPAAVPDAEAVALAETTAHGCADLDALKAAVEAFEGCNLKRSARHTLFEGGTRGAPLMLVGAAPSRDDDQNGAALSGLDGILADRMLAAIGVDRATGSYCGFCVPWAVPGGEPPTALQLKICAAFLNRQIALARPAVVVALGNTAARHLMTATEPITRLHGRWIERDFGGHETTVTALFDPAFLRETPRFKRHAWLDLLAIKKRLTDAPARQ